MERLWSHMRRYSKMTKEMRPSHRVDVLTDALLHCARKAATNLGFTFINLPLILYNYSQIASQTTDAKEVVVDLDCLTKKSPIRFHDRYY